MKLKDYLNSKKPGTVMALEFTLATSRRFQQRVRNTHKRRLHDLPHQAPATSPQKP